MDEDVSLKALSKNAVDRISDYLGFSTKELFDQGDFIAIFGGATRDSIADQEIHDIDILALSKSAHRLRDFILEKGYKPLDLYDKDQWEMYRTISIISEPWTFIKDYKIIQIIRPRYMVNKNSPIGTTGTDAFYDVIMNVDLSCCGTFLEKNNHPIKWPPMQIREGEDLMVGEIVLREACPDAILHCMSKKFETKYSKMYNKDRTLHREYKMIDRGWKKINDSDIPKTNNENLKNERNLKLRKMFFKPEYEFQIWKYREHLSDLRNTGYPRQTELMKMMLGK